MKISSHLRVAVLSTACLSLGASPPPALAPSATFESLRLRLEVDLKGAAELPHSAALQALDLLDQPAEIALELASEHPLRSLRVLAPDGRPVFSVTYARGAGLAGTELALEAEAARLRDVLARYPLGTYQVQGVTFEGELIAASVVLAGGFPGAFETHPAGNPRKLPIGAAELTWSAAHSAAGYELEVECEALGMEFAVRLPSTATSFVIPGQLLVPGETYEYSLNVQGDTDNELEVEGAFVTVP